MAFLGGLFGGVGRLFQPDTPPSTLQIAPAATTPGAAPGPGDPRRRLFGDGSVGGIAEGVGKILAYGPFAGMVQGSINRRLDGQAADARRRQAMPAPNVPMPGAVAAPNGQPGFGASASAPPVPGARSFPQAGSLPQDAIDHLRRNPGLAPHFDAKYGPGSAARILN